MIDHEKRKRRQNLRVVISEAIMVVTVIVTVILLAFIVSGYWLNSDFKVERQGLLQVYSTPTGATVNIDGENSSWLQRTNTSKTLASGKHTVTLSREGYDSWSKEVNISEGLLYRLHYPRLFLKDRTSERILETTATTFTTVSPDRNTLLLSNETTNWNIVNLEDEILKPKTLDIADYFSSVSVAEGAKTGLFSGKIIRADWDNNNDHILFENKLEEATEWVLLDVNNIKNSINLTKEFGVGFTDVKIFDNSSNNLLAVQNNNLHRIDVSGKSASAILVENIVDYDYYENEIAFTRLNNDNKYEVGLIRFSDPEPKLLGTFDAPIKIVISKFYDEIYLTTVQENLVKLYKKAEFEKVGEFELGFVPEKIKVGHDGEFIVMRSGSMVATLDREANEIREWEIEGKDYGWLDKNMIYSVSDGELIVYDFDGFNKRSLAKNVSDHFMVTITNDKWLYYFSDDNLVREWLIER